MSGKTNLVLAAILTLTSAFEVATLGAQAPDTTTLRDPVVITDVRVFTGEEVIERATVLLADGLIARIALPDETYDTPDGARLIDGEGRTLIPGLIDAHTHTFDRNYLKSATKYGVMTNLDMFTGLDVVRLFKDEQANGRSADRPDFFSAGILVTAAGGHGTQYGMPIPTLDTPADAAAFIEARLEEGSDYLKLVIEDGSAWGRSTPSLDAARVRAAVRAAHARGALVVAHVGSYEAALMAIDAGVDGMVHTFADRMPDADYGSRVAAAGVFVIPTLVVMDGPGGGAGGAAVLDDPVLGERLMGWEVANLEVEFPRAEGMLIDTAHAMAGVRAVIDAGGVVLAGSDAPNPGTVLGASLHRELELLVHAGLTPVQALQAATSWTANAFRLEGRGRIEEGARADVVLVGGDPTTDILDTRRVEYLWKEGRRWMLELALAQVEAERRGNEE